MRIPAPCVGGCTTLPTSHKPCARVMELMILLEVAVLLSFERRTEWWCGRWRQTKKGTGFWFKSCRSFPGIGSIVCFQWKKSVSPWLKYVVREKEHYVGYWSQTLLPSGFRRQKKKIMLGSSFGLMKCFFCEFLNQAVKVGRKPTWLHASSQIFRHLQYHMRL